MAGRKRLLLLHHAQHLSRRGLPGSGPEAGRGGRARAGPAARAGRAVERAPRRSTSATPEHADARDRRLCERASARRHRRGGRQRDPARRARGGRARPAAQPAGGGRGRARQGHHARSAARAAACPSPVFRRFPLADDPRRDRGRRSATRAWSSRCASRAAAASSAPTTRGSSSRRSSALKRILLGDGIDPLEQTDILVEDFIPGVEVALEGLLTDGELHVLAIFDKPDPLDGPFFEETIYVTPSRLPDETQAAIADCAARAARGPRPARRAGACRAARERARALAGGDRRALHRRPLLDASLRVRRRHVRWRS